MTEQTTTKVAEAKGEIKFYDGYEKGVLRGYPVEESAIRAFGITHEELKHYYADKYTETPWPVILREILNNRPKV